MKTTIFKTLALGLLSYTWVSGHSVEAAPSCPAFTAAMVDATMMAADISGPLHPDESSVATDDASAGHIGCFLKTDNSDTFEVYVTPDDILLVASYAGATLRTRIFLDGAELFTPTELHGCRSEVLKSFVWNQYCAPLVD